jgi:PAS domain S-box-containing protein
MPAQLVALGVVRHDLQLYKSDAFLLDQVEAFLRDGFRDGAQLIVIATPAHREALAARLAAESAQRPGGLALLDAEETLATFLVDGRPDWARFDAVVGALVRAAAARGKVHAFGEMVALLAKRGDYAGAVELERHWNRLLASVPAALLCAYPVGVFTGPQGAEALRSVCEAHQHFQADAAGEGVQDLQRYLELLQERSEALAAEVAARRRAEADLVAEREELRDFLENAVEGLHRVGPDGTILWANQAELDLLGYTAEEFVGRNIADFHVDPEVLASILERLEEGQTLRNQPARLRHRDGSVRHVLIHSNARRVDGRLAYTRCFTRDITERVELAKARRDALDAQTATTRLLESVTDGYLHIGPDWRITFANLGAGLEPRQVHQEHVGRLLWEAFPQVAGSQFEHHYRAVMQTRQPETFEAYYAPADCWFENRVFPAGAGIALYYRDITARRRLEAQLEARNQQQAAVARLGHQALACSLDEFLETAAREVAATLGADFCKVLELAGDGESLLLRAGHGWTPGLVGHARLSAGLDSQGGYTLESKHPVIVPDLARETRFHPPQLLLDHGVTSGMSVIVPGKERTWGVLGAHTKAARVFTEDDINFLQAVANLVASAIARHSVEEELREHRDNLEILVDQRTAQLRAANRELEAFSYTVSHDLRSPLRAIDGFSRILLQRHPDLPPPSRDLLAMLAENATRMGTLIESVLALSRLGRVDLQRGPVDLGRMATEILQRHAAAAPHRRVAWTVQEGLCATGDVELLRIVLENLLGNAWKFTAHTAEARIAVTQAPDGPFCVADNGAGFDMAHAANLFQPFHRMHTPEQFEGNGIGLATVARILLRHDGRVWAEAEPGKGARFHFTLPPCA